MAKENITITSNYDGVTVQKTVSNINPTATNAQLAQFGEMIADLTTGQYVKTDRVRKFNCDTEPGGGVKSEPTLTLSTTTATKSQIVEGVTVVISTNSSGLFYVKADPTKNDIVEYGTNGMLTYFFCIDTNTNEKQIRFKAVNPETLAAQTVYIGVGETNDFAAKEVAFTVTA